jgi:hypothetical protein
MDAISATPRIIDEYGNYASWTNKRAEEECSVFFISVDGLVYGWKLRWRIML